MIRNFMVGAASVLTLAAITGCSSSSSNNNNDSGTGNGADSSTGSDSGGGSDTGTTPTDDGGTGGDTGTTPVVDSGTPPPDDSGPPVEAGPPTCPAAFNAGMLQPFVPVTQMIGACSSTQLGSYATACNGTNQTNCTNFLTAAANATCVTCLFGAPADAGAVTSTGAFIFGTAADTSDFYNTPGCIALSEPDAGTGCEEAYFNRDQCLLVVCGQCSTNASFSSCETTALAAGGPCATYAATENTACAAELADGGAKSNYCGTGAAILNKICGTGMP